MNPDDQLAMVQRHVRQGERQGERHIRRQHAVIARLELTGHSTRVAEELLTSFESTLQNHRTHLARLSPAKPR